MNVHTKYRAIGRALLLGLAVLAGGCATPASAPKEKTVAVKIVAFNDFHGHLDVPAEGVLIRGAEVEAGGVVHFATLVERLRAQSRHFALVAAGDLTGASPLLSATFDDEPTIEAMNRLALDASALGNHELDRGLAHLRRLQQGGCPAGGCKSGKAFAGARFPYLAANVVEQATGEPLLPAYVVKTFEGIDVAFVGVTLKSLPSVSSPAAVAGLEFRDEADAVNALVPELERRGIEAIVVLVHQGGYTSGAYDECVDLRGPIVDIVRRLAAAVDVVVSGHTHRAYNCTVDGKLLTSAGAYGTMLTEIDLRLDSTSRDVVSARAANRLVGVDVSPDPALSALIEDYRKLAPSLTRVVGHVSEPLSRRANADGESPMGRFIADAQLAATATAAAGAAVAFVQPGAIRGPFRFKGSGEVTYEDVFGVYPFNDALVTMTLTGEQILRLLEAQWQGGLTQVLQVSRGFGYAWSASRPVGGRVVEGSVTIGGEPLQRTRRYRVTVNGFLARGGDGFEVLLEGTERVSGAPARDALLDFMAQQAPIAPPRGRRVRRVP